MIHLHHEDPPPVETPIREYNAGEFPVQIKEREVGINTREVHNAWEVSVLDGEGGPVPEVVYEKRLIVVAVNEGGYNHTAVDLLDLLAWVKQHRPELYAQA